MGSVLSEPGEYGATIRGLSRCRRAGMHGSSPCMTGPHPRVIQGVLPGLEPGIQEARRGDEAFFE
jgi:hypothetical protein